VTALERAITDLVPHRGRALLIERIIDEREDGVTCLGRLPPQAALAKDGRVPSYVGLEMAAQAAAAFEALRRPRLATGQEPRIGYLVSLSRVTIERPEMLVGMPFIVTVRSVEGAPPLARYEALVEADGEAYVRGGLSTMLAPVAGAAGGPAT